MSPGDYGKELVLDLHNCNIAKFGKKNIQEYFNILCDKIKMEQESVHFWEYPGGEEKPDAPLAHLKGISALQFIKTSSIVVHTIDDLKRVYINLFSCKDFDEDIAADFTQKYFEGEIKQQKTFDRI